MAIHADSLGRKLYCRNKKKIQNLKEKVTIVEGYTFNGLYP